MNEIFLRLAEAARKHGATGNSSIARLLNESPQVITNWANRGVPAKKIIEVAPLLGVSPEWLQTGKESRSRGEIFPVDMNALISVATETYLPELVRLQELQEKGVLVDADIAMLRVIIDRYKDRK